MKFTPRDVPPRTAWSLEQAGVPPLLARLYAARGVQSKDELDDGLARLLPPSGDKGMKGIDAAARLLADAMAQNLRLIIVADYDCDGATACAVAVRGLRLLGAKRVDYIVPDRVIDGYGLTPPISQRVKDSGADVLITVDNGIASVEGVAEAKALGLQVLVTDHHLPGPELPAADAIVNPNQPGCTFESKSMAGVGVMFYVLLALRAELRARGVFDASSAAGPPQGASAPLGGSEPREAGSAGATDTFDVIVVDFPDPTNFSVGKLYTNSFYSLLDKRLSASGYAVVQTTSPLVARQSFWTVVSTIESVGLTARPYHAHVPSFGEWGFVLAGRRPWRMPDALPGGLQFLSPQTLPLLFDFPLDMARVPAEVNRLSNQVLVHTYEREWGKVVAH